MHTPREFKDLEYQLDPESGLYHARVTADQLRSARQGTPEGEYHAPKFAYRHDTTDHQEGHHVHILKSNNGCEAISNLCVTRIGDIAVGYPHNPGKSQYTIDIPNMSQTFINRLKSIKPGRKQKGKLRLEELLQKDKPWTSQIPAEHVELFKIK